MLWSQKNQLGFNRSLSLHILLLQAVSLVPLLAASFPRWLPPSRLAQSQGRAHLLPQVFLQPQPRGSWKKAAQLGCLCLIHQPPRWARHEGPPLEKLSGGVAVVQGCSWTACPVDLVAVPKAHPVQPVEATPSDTAALQKSQSCHVGQTKAYSLQTAQT